MKLQDELKRLAVADSLGEHYRRVVLLSADRIDELERENERLRGRVNELAAIVRDFGDSAEYAEGYRINTESEA